MTSSSSHDILREEWTRPERAVVDIGSNTVRLVIYGGALRAPEPVLNEKVAAKLGRELAETGAIPNKAAEAALAALRRYRALLWDHGVKQVDVVATAAVREATNGAEFLEKVREIGLTPRLLSGEEEAHASATGIIAAFPGAKGVVADLGGGSLELVSVDQGRVQSGQSLPLGTLRLSALRAQGTASFRRTVHRTLAEAGWAAEHPGPLYMVGGTWRALAKYAMLRLGHPLSDPHGLTLATAEAERMAKKLATADRESLKAVSGLSAMRASALPDAAALLRAMLAEIKPTELVFSSWGLREGLLYQRLGAAARKQDPLLTGIAHFTAPRGGAISRAAMVAGWTSDVLRSQDSHSERLRLAATLLALTARGLEPNLRTRHALGWALHKRWIGVDMAGRARMAAALIGACGKPGLPAELLALTDEALLHEAICWGLAVRLCCRIGGASGHSLAGSALFVEGDRMVLAFDRSGADLLGEVVRADLDLLAGWCGLTGEVRIADRLPSERS